MNASVQIDRLPLSLTDLPAEILSQVTRLLDRPSAISFALVSRVFTVPAESRLWRDLDLTLPPNFGRRPWVRPCEEGTDGYELLNEEEVARVREDCRTELRERIRKMSSSWDERRMGLVRAFKIVSCYGTVNQTISILTMVNSTLRYLHFVLADWSPEWQSIDIVMFQSITSFPALTHIRIDFGAIIYADFLTTLVAGAPNLVHLEASIDSSVYSVDWESESLIEPPPLTRNTKIRYLSVSCYDNEVGAELIQHPMRNIILFSPLLEKCPSDTTTIMTTWAISGGSDYGESYLSLRRLTLQSYGIFRRPLPIPHLPSLEILCFSGTPLTFVLPPPSSDPPFDHPYGKVFDALRDPPRLRYIHNLGSLPLANGLDLFTQLDECEAAANFAGRVSSIHNGEYELVLLRFKHHPANTDSGEIPDIARQDKSGHSDAPCQDSWVDSASLWNEEEERNLDIPMDVLKEMRRSQGVGAEEWEGRDIIVRDDTWQVLMDWVRERQGEAGKAGGEEEEGMDEEDGYAS